MSGSDVVALAKRIATEAHRGQFRRDGITPYIHHPAAVASRVADDRITEAIAWLHDVLEDTNWTREDLENVGVPPEVVNRVLILTKCADVGYENYLIQIKADPITKRVKIADMLSNLSDNPSERQILKYAKGLITLLA